MQIRLHRNFIKNYARLPKTIKVKFKERRDIFIQNKFDQILSNHSVEKRFPGCRSINITGDYRAIYKDVDDVCIFMKIGTHSDLY